MSFEVDGKTVAILVADGFEQIELTEPRQRLEQAGVRTCLVSLRTGRVRGWRDDHFADAFPVEATLEAASVGDFDALLLPGGVLHPDVLRSSEAVVRFVRGFFHAGKPVAAICHGLQPLIDAGVVRNRTLTSCASLKVDLVNAGANWVDATVVVDQGLVTSRSASDIGDFVKMLLEELAARPRASGCTTGGGGR